MKCWLSARNQVCGRLTLSPWTTTVVGDGGGVTPVTCRALAKGAALDKANTPKVNAPRFRAPSATGVRMVRFMRFLCV